MIASAPRSMFLLTTVAAISLLAAPASAGPDTLKRSVGNMVFFPIDLVTSPVTAGIAVVNNIQDIDDTTGVRVAYAVPGYIFMTGLNIGASVLRGVTGLLEFLPGLVLVFIDADMTPLYVPVEDNKALVNWQNDVFPVKFGIDYATSDR